MLLSENAVKVKESSTLAITAKAKEMKASGIDVVNFGAGEPDFDTPKHIKDAAVKALDQGFTKYTPSSGTVELRKAICKKLKDDNCLEYTPNQIIVSNGAKHSLTNIFMAIINPGDEVILPAPYWLSYAEMVRIAYGKPVIVHTDRASGFKASSKSLKSALTKKTKAIVINNPNNPTGMVYTKDELADIADFAVKNNLFVVSDEIYEKLIYGENIKHISIASLGKEIYDRTIVVNGFSKSYAMTGWRVGYTASSAEIALVMGNIQSHFTSNVNSIAQKAALEALTAPQESVENMRREFEKRRDYIYGRISAIRELDILKPEGAFYAFVDVSKLCGSKIIINGEKIDDGAAFAKVLLENAQVASVPCVDFGFDKYLRLSYAISMQEIEKGINRLEEFIKMYYK